MATDLSSRFQYLDCLICVFRLALCVFPLVDAPMGDDYLVFHILHGLNPDLREIFAALHAGNNRYCFDEINDKL